MPFKSTRAILLSFVALCLVAIVAACGTPPTRAEVETQYGATALGLIPDGRIFSADLAADGPVSVRGAWLLDELLLVEYADGSLLALDRHNLSPQWSFKGLVAPMEFPPALTPVSVLAIAKGLLYEIDRRNGNQLGVSRLAFVPAAGPAGTDSTAYLPALASIDGNRTICTINLAIGIEGWGRATRGSITVAPLVGGTSGRPVLYTATSLGEVFAFPAEPASSGAPEPHWSSLVHGRVLHPMVLDDDILFVGSERGDLWALDRITGSPVWVNYSGEPILAKAWPAGDQVYFVNEAGLHALSRENGQLLWSHDGLARFLCRRGGTVFPMTSPGHVAAVDTTTGDVLRTAEFPPDTIFPANTADHIFYFLTVDGLVVAVDRKLD
jgi:outer membrane protein assembly factor BamB